MNRDPADMTEPHSDRCTGDPDGEPHSARSHIPLHRRKTLWIALLAKIVAVALALVFLREVEVRFGIEIALLHAAVIVTVLAYIFWARARGRRAG